MQQCRTTTSLEQLLLALALSISNIGRKEAEGSSAVDPPEAVDVVTDQGGRGDGSAGLFEGPESRLLSSTTDIEMPTYYRCHHLLPYCCPS